MIQTQDLKFTMLLAPISLNSAAITPIACDCIGYHYASVCVLLGVVGGDWGASPNNLRITECDTSGGSYADVTSATWAVATATSAGLIELGFIDLRKRKRFLKLSGTSGVTTLIGAVAILSRSEQTPDTAALRGAEFQFIV